MQYHLLSSYACLGKTQCTGDGLTNSKMSLANVGQH